MRGCGYQDVARYGQAFRDRIVARLLPPESAAIDVVSREVGVSIGTLERWRAQALAAPGELTSSQRWTPAARLEAVITTAAMDETARSAWCREQGLFPAELEAWKRDAIAGLGEPRAASAVEARQDRRRVKELERELHRKDKALAETAALLVLRKKLGRQSWLASLLLQRGEISAGVAPELAAEGSCMTPLVEALAEISPAFPADAAQVARGGRAQPCRRGRDQPHLAAQHHRGRSRPAPGCAPLMVPLRAEQLLEAVVGAREVGDGVAVEQAGPVAAGDLAEVLDGLGQMARSGAVARHGPDQSIEAPPDHGGGLAGRVAQDARRPVHPAVDALDVRPEWGGALQATADQSAQARERRRPAPFSATRSRLSATASRRALSFRPEAASGGRPSSVMALRTAAQ